MALLHIRRACCSGWKATSLSRWARAVTHLPCLQRGKQTPKGGLGMPLASKVSPCWGHLSFLLPAGRSHRCCSTSPALTSCFSNFVGRYRASTPRAGSMNVYGLWLSDWKHCESNKPPSKLLTLRSRTGLGGAFQVEGRCGFSPSAYCQGDRHLVQMEFNPEG